MKKELAKAEESGRLGDALLGHLTPGDVIIPRGMVSPELRAMLAQMFDLDLYTAGSERNSINPVTGLPEFNDAGFDGGGYSPESAAQAGDMSGLGFGSPGAGGMNSSGPGSLGAEQGGFAGFMEALGNAFSNSTPAPNDQMDTLGTGGGMDSLNPGWENPLLPQPQALPVNFGTSVAALAPPTSPDVPDTLPQIGQYYSLMRAGDRNAAENLLSQFMRGDKNVYGR